MPEEPRDRYRPWTLGQVQIVSSWPTRLGQPVSVALSPAGNRLALTVGHQLDVSDIAEGGRVAPRPQKLACALVPGLTWSPGGDKLAFRDPHGHGRLLELSKLVAPETETRTLALGAVNAMAFAPDGERLAVLAPSLPGRMTLQLIRLSPELIPGREVIWERQLIKSPTPSYHAEAVNLAFSPDGHRLTCTTGTSTVWVFDTVTGEQARLFDDHVQMVTGVDWIDNDRVLSASADATLRVWTLDDSVPATVVETIEAAGMVFVREQSTALIWARGELLAWSLEQTPTQLWDREPPMRNVAAYFARLAVSAVDGLLALIDAGTADLVLVSAWESAVSAPPATTTYANAKVVVLGDSGVGKSGLAMVLAGEDFKPTYSTHGRRIWRLPAADEQGSAADGREVMLWDLAGQPGYRIVHQLHLEDAALALILFDAKSEVAPLDGVEYWARAIQHAHPGATGGLTTFLVASRCDRGGTSVSNERIEKLKADFGLTGDFKTSATEGTNVGELRAALLAAIDWARIPEVTSTRLFAEVKQFVVDQKSSGTLLIPVDELCRTFLTEVPGGRQLLAENSGDDDARESSPDQLISVFEGCVARLGAAGLVKRLKFGNYVLLLPELLDAYAGAIVDAARDEPDGLGSILETKVFNLDFPVPFPDRMEDKRQERLLVLATLEELLQRELVLQQPTADGVQLVFPTAHRRDLPASQMPQGNGVVFRFEGPIPNIYATLIVRLARSDVFVMVETWQSAARFAADDGEAECTVALKTAGEGAGALWIGYDRMPDSLREQFERFVHAHLERQATPGTVTRERQYSCPRDGTAFTAEQVQRAIRRGRAGIMCPDCERRVPLRDDYEFADGTDGSTEAMEASADAHREIAAASAVVRGKEEVAEYDVFLCHNWKDKTAVREIAQQLRERGLRPWVDERQLRPGGPWQAELEDIIAGIGAAAVIMGERLGNWQRQELDALMRQHVKRRCVIVPVLLSGVERRSVPVFLENFTWVDLNKTEPNPIDQLVWGITGTQPIS